MNPIQPGTVAPLFSLKNQNDETINLADYIGKNKVVVYFYPKASTPGCTVQACGLRDSKTELDALNVKVFGLSPDPVKRISNFVTKQELNFDLLADEDHATADAYGVWGLKKFMGREYDGIHRISFLIGLDGKIEHVFNKFKTKDHHEVVLDYLKQS
ncbi:thioredoxin-dependent thiol peroxidase [Saccharobesus litoralis]|uniref:thioredoxin-dependent peroxiredoxin n=1 Tax=Saccharobesus litoralis TaxID=2172099 RepID=A0A2S0VL88_9ALTE|nr:thioredoxin-dependent thiol peroxidase [Saccharobesus litoralis]AWB64967.1 thioredoxin-dependent thiol peroxidase [Saccharobesus litoralis]